MLKVLILVLAILGSIPVLHLSKAEHVTVGRNVLEGAARRFLMDENDLMAQDCTKVMYATWNYYTNLTDHNKEALLDARLDNAALVKESWTRLQTWSSIRPHILDEELTRMFKSMSVLGTPALPDEDLVKITRVVAEMQTVYSTAKVCSYSDPSKCDLTVGKELNEIMRTSRDNAELTHAWKTWRDNSGKKIRNQYREFLPLANKAARANGYDNMGDLDLASYETESFRDDIDNVWQQLKPLYQQLHAYTRRKLREVYGPEIVTERGPIPAHLLGNMWALMWQRHDILLPYPHKTSIDATPEMVRQGYTPKRMFKLSDEFFSSLNLTKMPDSFWEDSLLEDPGDRQVNCHPSAFDFCNGKDYRIKQCTQVNMNDLITIHHEMGHIQYFLQYKNLPYIFRTGANPGFHEAVGDTLALSVATPKHLHKIGLLESVYDDYEADINFLLQMALDKVAFLPYAYTMDLWRWRIFDGTYTQKDWNCGWWDLRYEVQGVKPPLVRTEEDFDPGSKYHVAANRGYIQYFVSFILQFQFHKAMCLKAGEYDPQDPNKPLHKCDIYQSAEAGNAFGDMLKMGNSRPWNEAMRALTGQEKMDAGVLREYFKPLEDWLIRDNLRHQEFVGWRPDGEYCVYKSPDPQRNVCNLRGDGE